MNEKLIDEFNFQLARVAELRDWIKSLKGREEMQPWVRYPVLDFLVTAADYIEVNLRGLRDKYELGIK